jgi:hypothetical protein
MFTPEAIAALIPVYDGNPDGLMGYLRTMKAAYSLIENGEESMKSYFVIVAKSKLTGEASSVVDKINPIDDEPIEWKDIEEALNKNIFIRENREILLEKLGAMKQGNTESITSFHQRCEKIKTKLVAVSIRGKTQKETIESEEINSERFAIRSFIKGLQDNEIKKAVHSNGPKTMYAALEEAQYAESLTHGINPSQKSETKHCNYCKKKGHTLNECFKRNSSLSNNSNNETQQQQLQYRPQQQQQQQQYRRENTSWKQDGSNNKITCMFCGKIGHWASQCRSRQNLSKPDAPKSNVWHKNSGNNQNNNERQVNQLENNQEPQPGPSNMSLIDYLEEEQKN